MNASRVYVVLGVWDGSDFVPFHRTRDPELVRLTADNILEESRVPEGASDTHARLIREDAGRLRKVFAEFGIRVGTETQDDTCQLRV